MATGLTFGSISALFGLTHRLIDNTQYTELVTVVILSAFVPTLIAQQLFQPTLVDTEEEEALGAEDPPPGGRQVPVTSLNTLLTGVAQARHHAGRFLTDVSQATSRRQLIREATSEMGTYTTTGRPAQAGRVAPIRPGS